jgi:hypothetical protein
MRGLTARKRKCKECSHGCRAEQERLDSKQESLNSKQERLNSEQEKLDSEKEKVQRVQVWL